MLYCDCFDCVMFDLFVLCSLIVCWFFMMLFDIVAAVVLFSFVVSVLRVFSFVFGYVASRCLCVIVFVCCVVVYVVDVLRVLVWRVC